MHVHPANETKLPIGDKDDHSQIPDTRASSKLINHLLFLATKSISESDLISIYFFKHCIYVLLTSFFFKFSWFRRLLSQSCALCVYAYDSARAQLPDCDMLYCVLFTPENQTIVYHHPKLEKPHSETSTDKSTIKALFSKSAEYG